MESFMIMMLVLFEVALWQWRVAITIRGNLLGGVLLGLVGAVVQVTAISWVVRDMGDVTKVAGYAVGVAIGVGVGGLIDRRLSTWDASVRVFAPAGTRPRFRAPRSRLARYRYERARTRRSRRNAVHRGRSAPDPPSWSACFVPLLRTRAGRSSASPRAAAYWPCRRRERAAINPAVSATVTVRAECPDRRRTLPTFSWKWTQTPAALLVPKVRPSSTNDRGHRSRSTTCSST